MLVSRSNCRLISFQTLYFDSPASRAAWATSTSAVRRGKAVGQDRDERAVLTALEHGIDDVAVIGAQHAAVVVHHDAGRRLTAALIIPDITRRNSVSCRSSLTLPTTS